jgi:hypothetical protein
MKTLLITAIASLFMFHAVYSQTSQEQVAAIDITRKAIDNNTATYQKTEQRKNGTSSKSVFMDGRELKLVTIEVTENGINKKVNLYFTNGELIYATQVGTDVKTGILVDNEKTYVNNKQAFVWLKKGNISVESSSKNFKAMNTELMAYAAQLEKESTNNYPLPLAKK